MVTVANHQAHNLRNLPAAAIDGLTVAELLTLPSMVDTTVLAGASGLGRRVRRVNLPGGAGIPPWGEADEVLLRTAFAPTPAPHPHHGGAAGPAVPGVHRP